VRLSTIRFGLLGSIIFDLHRNEQTNITVQQS